MAANTAASGGPYVTLGAAVLNVCPIAKINVAPACPESRRACRQGVEGASARHPSLSRKTSPVRAPAPPNPEASSHSERSASSFLLPEIVSSRFPSSGESHQQDELSPGQQSSTRSRRISLPLLLAPTDRQDSRDLAVSLTPSCRDVSLHLFAGIGTFRDRSDHNAAS